MLAGGDMRMFKAQSLGGQAIDIWRDAGDLAAKRSDSTPVQIIGGNEEDVGAGAASGTFAKPAEVVRAAPAAAWRKVRRLGNCKLSHEPAHARSLLSRRPFRSAG